MQNTTNFGYKKYEGTDLFNPLIVEAANIEAIDENERDIELKTVGTATELMSGTVHAITRADEGCAMFRFTATANFTAGETFTVDGQQVTALLTTGEQLGTGAYIIGSEVLCCLRDTLLTVYCNAGTVTVADDANKLGGNPPAYYGTAADTAEAVRVAQSANAISLNNQEAISSLNQQIAGLGTYSTAEIEVGKWGDEKLYRRTYHIDSLGSNASSQQIDKDFKYSTTIKHISGVYTASSQRRQFPYVEGTTVIREIIMNGANGLYIRNYGSTITDIDLVLEYTKPQTTT